jgi:hypothetical protein
MYRYLIEEGRAGSPKMMNIGLHCRLARPGRVAGIAEFLDFAKSYKKDVWFCTREQIADFWYENHYPRGAGSPVKPPSTAVEGEADEKPHAETENGYGELTEAPAEDPAVGDGDII